VLQYDEVEFDEFFTFLEEPVDILAKDMWRLRSRDFIVDKVYWRHRQVEESTWEIKLDIREQFPRLFKPSSTS